MKDDVMTSNPLTLALDEYLVSTGDKATSSGWVEHVRDATTLQDAELTQVYANRQNLRKRQMQHFVNAMLFAPPSVQAASIGIR